MNTDDTPAFEKTPRPSKPRKAVPIPGRNSLCPCGSKKKFKVCCMDEYAQWKRWKENQ